MTGSRKDTDMAHSTRWFITGKREWWHTTLIPIVRRLRTVDF